MEFRDLAFIYSLKICTLSLHRNQMKSYDQFYGVPVYEDIGISSVDGVVTVILHHKLVTVIQINRVSLHRTIQPSNNSPTLYTVVL